jgi:hypothetical protein
MPRGTVLRPIDDPARGHVWRWQPNSLPLPQKTSQGNVREKGEISMTKLEKQMDSLLGLADERMAEYRAMRKAIEAWHKYWDYRYDGEPLKDHEVLLLNAFQLLQGSL